MPRHPPNALTSRLRIHTINDRPGNKVVAACIRRQLPSPHATSLKHRCGRYNLSQIFKCRIRPSSAQNAKFERCATASIKKPIHNVKEAGKSRKTAEKSAELVSVTGVAWWSQSGSNRRPQACKASALPTELWPHRSKQSGNGGPERI